MPFEKPGPNLQIRG